MKKLLCMLLCVLLLTGAVSVLAEESEGVSAEAMVQELLETQIAKQKDAWILAVLESGAQDIRLEENQLSFTLCGFDPNLTALGKYAAAGDKAAWTASMLENIAGHNATFTIKLQADGTINKNGVNQFMNAVKKVVNVSKKAVNGKEVASALTDLLFCSPTTDRKPTAQSLLQVTDAFEQFIAGKPEVFPCEDASEWAPMLYAQRNQHYRIKNGPHAIEMTWDGISPSKLLDTAYGSISSELAAQTKAERLSLDALPDVWKTRLAESSVALMKKRLVRKSATLDLTELAHGVLPEGYVQYFAQFTPAATYQKLVDGYALLPDEASQPMPKTGTVSAKVKKGRTVTFNNPDGGSYVYLQMRDADTNVIVTDAFIEPGKSLNIKVPEGFYVIQYAGGYTWYGTEGLFGPLGTYSASEEISIAKKKWKVTPLEEGNGIILHPIKVADFAVTEDKSIHIQGVLDAQVPIKTYPAVNPVIPGVSSTTGLPASGEPYTPVVIVLDNAEDAYPHWGVSQADIIFQVPNAGSGATKLLALFADHYPSQAGPVRSGRASMLPAVTSFNAAFAYAGPPAVKDDNIDIDALMSKYRMTYTHRVYNLLHDNGFKERFHDAAGGHNLSCHIDGIHDNLVTKNVEFEERPFLFTDEKRTDGETANIIRVLHRGESADTASNSASRAVFRYLPETGEYTRTNSSGKYSDRLTGETVTFANVIVLRVKFSWEKNYVFLRKHLVGSGTAEIFQDGRYIRGAWTRDDVTSRLVFTDADGSELKFKRGKTFIVMTNEVTDVIYSE
ncbi:MAG: DUF3048 C-terminal domain-containing protein [Clostridia bacterium]|nr:DUF3048 C-terminal domain-containing protein [Clostridia bacterium]